MLGLLDLRGRDPRALNGSSHAMTVVFLFRFLAQGTTLARQ